GAWSARRRRRSGCAGSAQGGPRRSTQHEAAYAQPFGGGQRARPRWSSLTCGPLRALLVRPRDGRGRSLGPVRPLRVPPPTVRRIALALLVSLVAVSVVGAVVRLTGSGLGCSTWPNCEPDSFTP